MQMRDFLKSWNSHNLRNDLWLGLYVEVTLYDYSNPKEWFFIPQNYTFHSYKLHKQNSCKKNTQNTSWTQCDKLASKAYGGKYVHWHLNHASFKTIFQPIPIHVCENINDTSNPPLGWAKDIPITFLICSRSLGSLPARVTALLSNSLGNGQSGSR